MKGVMEERCLRRVLRISKSWKVDMSNGKKGITHKENNKVWENKIQSIYKEIFVYYECSSYRVRRQE